MASCKDCFFNGVCRHNWQDWELKSRGIENRMDEACKDFKDKSLFVELPCKVGDTVYEVKPYLKSYQKKHPNDKGYIVESIVKGIHKHTSQSYKNPYQVRSYLVCENPVMNGYYKRYSLDKIGKTVFLTREEAEQKLKELENAK